MIRFLDVSKYFGNRLIFDQINCQIEIPSFNCLLGAMGSGKSTFFQLILNETIPDGGQVLFLQQPLGILKDKTLAQHRQHIGMIPQTQRFLRHENAQANILLPLAIRKKQGDEGIEKMKDWGGQLGLLQCLNRPIDELSQGERQCVSVLRALIHDPILILADDPTQHLAEDLARVVINLLYEAYLKGATVIVAAQAMNFIPRKARILQIQQYQIQEF